MRKLLSMVLAIALVMSLGVTAFAAVVSVGQEDESAAVTAPLPVVVAPEAAVEVAEDAPLVAVADVKTLTEEEQKVFAEAQATVKEAAPEGMVAKYFAFYTGEEAELTIETENVKEIVVFQFVDGKWVKLDAVLGADGKVVIKGLVKGPIAVFTK